MAMLPEVVYVHKYATYIYNQSSAGRVVLHVQYLCEYRQFH